LFIKGILIRPPFIVRSKSNIRKDFFSETSNNFLTSLRLDTKKFYAFPIKVGKSLAYVYFHIDYFYQAVSLANLFESAYKKEFLNKKPEIILIYGTNSSIDGKIYHDKINDIYIGIVNNQTKNDYFGYLKKILLTLYNLRSIDHNILPIHGAMVQITLKNHGVKNVVLVGDSGAGKSETLEALKRVGQDNIKNIEVIFDDMGSFSVHHKRVYASGTEIGAFVRLDDLEADYAYREIDRAIMVNPEKKNSRVIIPIAEYDLITALHPIDFVLYANNYETNIKTNVRLFNDLDKIKKIFIEGKRMAKGTTSESGMSKSFFANPFGPMQRIKQSTKMIDNYFIMLKHNGVAIGEIYTRLAIPSYEQDGPNMAATSLLKLLLRN
jgi:energy-coupling factor transporter ATP-binding protein EcfA2